MGLFNKYMFFIHSVLQFPPTLLSKPQYDRINQLVKQFYGWQEGNRRVQGLTKELNSIGLTFVWLNQLDCN